MILMESKGYMGLLLCSHACVHNHELFDADYMVQPKVTMGCKCCLSMQCICEVILLNAMIISNCYVAINRSDWKISYHNTCAHVSKC